MNGNDDTETVRLTSFLDTKRNASALSDDSKPGAVWVEGIAGNTSSFTESINSRNGAGPDGASFRYSNRHYSDSTCDIPDGSNLDPNALAALPDDIRREVIEQEVERLGEQGGNDCSGGSSECNIPEGSNLDPDALAGLPDDIRREVIQLEVERLERDRPKRPDDDDDDLVTAKVTAYTSQEESGEYDGEYDSKGRKHGRGVIRWKNGDRYEGMFQNGFRSGMGTLKQTDGTFYSGGWKKDLFHGNGTRHFPSGSTYTGQFKDNKCNGEGRCIFSNGDNYTGDWKNGFMEGFGTYTHASGEQFEGMYKNNKRHGPGKFRTKDGKMDVVRYNEGMRIGYGVHWSSNETKASFIKETAKIKKISVEQGRSITKKVLADVANAHADDLEYHIPSKEKKRFPSLGKGFIK